MQVSVIVVHVETKELAFWSACCKKNIAGSKIQIKIVFCTIATLLLLDTKIKKLVGY